MVEATALAPAPEPDLPTVLQPNGQPPVGSLAGPDPAEPPHGMDHDRVTERPAATMEADDASMAHTAMHHGASVMETPSPTPPEPLGDVPPAPVAPLSGVLDAYLALQEALAGDRLDADAARAFEEAFARLAESPPEGDVHFWHARADDVTAVQTHAAALAATADLAEARAAFGHLSVPFARLMEDAGLPEGYALERYTCGMARDVPEGGVWLQRAGETRNPYFGSAMLRCGASDGPLDDAAAHDAPGDHE